MLDNSGAIKDTITYSGFGEILNDTNATFRGRYAWTGREMDTETGFQFNRARYYDPRTGKWTSQDPLGFDAGDSNLYRYAANGQNLRTDSSGLQSPLLPIPDKNNDTARTAGTEFTKAAGTLQFEIGKGNRYEGQVKVYKDVTTDADGEGQIEVEFIVTGYPPKLSANIVGIVSNPIGPVLIGPLLAGSARVGTETRPAAKFHWLQMLQRYILDDKGKEVNKTLVSISNKLWQKYEKGLMRVDSEYNNVAYYDDSGAHRRQANEISIFDRPSFGSLGEGFGAVKKAVAAFDDYLIYDDTKVMYHVHWERVANYKDGEVDGNPYYANISGQAATKLPNFGFGKKLLRGYETRDPKTDALSDPQYVRNPVP